MSMHICRTKCRPTAPQVPVERGASDEVQFCETQRDCVRLHSIDERSTDAATARGVEHDHIAKPVTSVPACDLVIIKQ